MDELLIWLYLFIYFYLLKHVWDFAKKFVQFLHTLQRNPKELFGQPNTSEFYDLIFDHIYHDMSEIPSWLMAQRVESACNVEDLSLILGSKRSPGEENGNALQYSCLENPMNGGAWRPTGLQSIGSQRVRQNWTTSFSLSSWHETIWLAEYSACSHDLAYPGVCLSSVASFSGFLLYHRKADPSKLQFPGSHDSKLLTASGQEEEPADIWRWTKEKIRILLSILFLLCSILLSSSVTPASFHQVCWVPDSTEWLWL